MSEPKYTPIANSEETAELEDIQPDTYEYSRSQQKNNTTMTVFYLIRSTTGLGFFTMQAGIIRTGYVYGFLLTAFIIFIATWGMVTLSKLCDAVEEESLDGSNTVTSLQDLINRIGCKTGKWLKPLQIISVIANIQGSTISNILVIINYISPQVVAPGHEWIIRLSQFLIMQVFIIYIVEPERFAQVSLICTIIIAVICLSMFVNNCMIATNKGMHQQLIFDFNGTFIFIGIVAFIYESAATIINVRRTMQNPKTFAVMTWWTYAGMGLFMYVFGASFLMAYGKDNHPPAAFAYYNVSNQFFSSLVYFYSFTCILTFQFNTSCTSEILEETCMRCLYVDKAGNQCKWKIVQIRASIWTLGNVVCLLINNINVVLNLVGTICSPFFSYIAPMIMLIEYRKRSNIKPTFSNYFLYAFITLASSFIIGSGLYQFIHNAMTGKSNGVKIQTNWN